MNKIFRVKLFILLLVTVSAARAMVLIGGIGRGEASLGPFNDPDPNGVDVRAGNELVLTEPGTYSAVRWDMGGELRLSAAGNYFIVARAGAITFGSASAIHGPATGTARVTFLHAGEFVAAPSIAGNVTVYNGIKPPPEQPPLLNFSTRLTLAAGQTATSGFVLGGTESRRVLVRAIGPTLANFGIQNPLAMPWITLSRPGQSFAYDGDVLGAPAAAAMVGAFPLPRESRDMAYVVSLNPGPYTLEVSAGIAPVLVTPSGTTPSGTTPQVSDGAGEVLVEIYLLP